MHFLTCINLRNALLGVFVLCTVTCFAGGTDGYAREATFVLMTDTHVDMKCSVSDLEYLANWIVANKASRNIAYAGHLGDVGDRRGSGPLYEMLRLARAALQPIADTQIPFSVAMGNHDYRDDGEHPRSAAAFNHPDAFGLDFYRDAPGFKGTFEGETESDLPHPGGTANHYFVLTLADEDFLFLTLEHYPRDAVMKWADALVRERYPDHHVVVCTHAYLTRQGTLSSGRHGDNESPGPEFSNSGEDMWHKYFRHWENLRFVFNGHFIDEPRQHYLQQTGVHGNIVHSHFFNYQNWGYKDGELYNTRSGGRYQAATVRLITIHFDENTVRIENYLPHVDDTVEPAHPATHFFLSAP